MRKIWIFIATLFISVPLIGQGKSQLNDMLTESIFSYLDYSADLHSKVCKNCEPYDLPYICKDGLPSNFPYDSFQHITFFSVDFFKMYSNPFKKKLKKGIGALFVNFELTNNHLCITVSSRSVKLVSKKIINVGISDWGRYFYKYSCDDQQWILIETKYDGI